jgi:hypothetical protein
MLSSRYILGQAPCYALSLEESELCPSQNLTLKNTFHSPVQSRFLFVNLRPPLNAWTLNLAYLTCNFANYASAVTFCAS